MRTIVSSRIAGEGLLKNVTSLPSNPPTLLSSKRVAFTLAEVLITLAIVGVVAAITLPPLITNIQSQVKAKRVQNIKQKFSKATDKMLAMSGMNGYGSTENFVEELKHHLKIAKVCDNDHLTECWGYEKVKLKDGKEWEISKTKTGKTLKMSDSETEEWADTVGIVTADGTSMILSYNKKCDMTMNVNPQWTTDKSTSADCVAAVFDWNGGKNPNMFNHSDAKHIEKSDITLFNAGGLGTECIVELNGRCFGKAFSVSDIDAAKYGYTWCTDGLIITQDMPMGFASISAGEAKTLGIERCRSINDYWSAGVVKCGGINKLPSSDELLTLASLIYGVSREKVDSTRGMHINEEFATSIGFPILTYDQAISVWTKEEVTNAREANYSRVRTRVFHARITNMQYSNRNTNKDYLLFCSVE